jgi:hypothetical protein
MVTLPDGDEMPAVVTSFANSNAGVNFFVMSTPSVWREGGMEGRGLGLETLMTAVLLHEGMHVAQIPTYGAQITELAEQYDLPESFNDDSIQERFESEAEFSASVAEEIELLFAAAAAPSDADVRRLAAQARALMQERHDRWFTGVDSYFRVAEDLWLVMEGSGQWAGYTWLTSHDGAAVSAELAMPAFGRRGRRWTQDQGLAIFLVIERFGGDWKKHIFADGNRTTMQLLDEILSSE